MRGLFVLGASHVILSHAFTEIYQLCWISFPKDSSILSKWAKHGKALSTMNLSCGLMLWSLIDWSSKSKSELYWPLLYFVEWWLNVYESSSNLDCISIGNYCLGLIISSVSNTHWSWYLSMAKLCMLWWRWSLLNLAKHQPVTGYWFVHVTL